VSLALIFGIFAFYKLAEKKGLNTSKIFDNIIWIILVGLIGARVGYMITHFSYYAKYPLDILKIWQGGLVFHGGFFGGFLVMMIWLLRDERENLCKWLDSAIPALVLANGIGKIGCFLNGCCYGRKTSLPWAIKIPVLGDNIPRHPVQIYESLAFLLVFLILILINRKKFKFDGFIFFFGLILHSLVRFGLEYYRQWIVTVKIFNITFSDAQVVCSIIIICAIIGLVWKKNLSKN
jgi:phosphatidylglycerol:prolipoprotein diacylglycerol transferase